MTLLRTAIAASTLALTLLDATPSSAQIVIDLGILVQPTWKCRKWDLTACSASDLANSYYRQVLVMPTGSGDGDRAQFWSDFDGLIRQMSSAGTVWSTTNRTHILYVGYFVSGGSLGSGTAAFNGSLASNAVAGAALYANPSAIDAKIAEIRATTLPYLRPMGVGLLFNDTSSAPPSATPPNFDHNPYGIARFTRAHLNSPWAPARELATAVFGFLAETVTRGFEETSVRVLDLLTPSLKLGGDWGAVGSMADPWSNYDYAFTDLFVGNGTDNLSLSTNASTVSTWGFPMQTYEYEGGLGFGRGLWHKKGSNLLNDDTVMRGADDGLAYAHSASQQGVIDTLFNGATPRPNDRLRTAGPKGGWPLALGSTTRVMIYDADKNHPIHPTQSYVVQVGWYERQWYTAWYGPFPYPAYNDVWTTAQKTVYPSRRTIQFDASSASGLVNLAQQLVCAAGVTAVPKPGTTATTNPCGPQWSAASSATDLPAFAVLSPYQDVDVPAATQWNTTYWWRVSSSNGTTSTNWTGWSSFYRSL